MDKTLKIAFSGRLRAGKDYVSQQCGLTIMGFADPMYVLCAHLIGSSDKSVPGVREVLQRIGQIGWGCVNEKYPLTPERHQFEDLMRFVAPYIFQDHTLFSKVDWSEFGRRNDFWVNILLTRPDLRAGAFRDTGVGVVNARFYHELEPLQKAEFHHFHIKCSLKTRKARIGAAWNEQTDNDTSEAMAADLDEKMPDNRVVWNDDEPMPEGHHYLTVGEFVQIVKVMRNTRHQGLAYQTLRAG